MEIAKVNLGGQHSTFFVVFRRAILEKTFEDEVETRYRVVYAEPGAVILIRRWIKMPGWTYAEEELLVHDGEKWIKIPLKKPKCDDDGFLMKVLRHPCCSCNYFVVDYEKKRIYCAKEMRRIENRKSRCEYYRSRWDPEG